MTEPDGKAAGEGEEYKTKRAFMPHDLVEGKVEIELSFVYQRKVNNGLLILTKRTS